MANYKLVAMSDFHLGHVSCLLRNNQFANGLDEALDSMISQEEDGPEIQKIKTLVLNGDIIDAALCKADEMYIAAGDFFKKLTNKIEIEKIVILPGNHDRILLKDAIDLFLKSGKEHQYNDGVFPVEGIKVSFHEELFNMKIKYYQDLSLLQLYGLKNKQENLNINSKTKIYFANPVYYEKIGEKSIIFNHGFHVYPEYFSLISNSKTLNDLEKNTVNIVTTIWNNRANQNISLQKSIWTGVQFLQAQLLRIKNLTVYNSKPWILLKKDQSKWNWKLNIFRNFVKRPKIEFFRKLWGIFKNIPNTEITKNNLIFIWGHIHNAESKTYYVNSKIGNVTSFNTGAWCSWHKAAPPHSCILTLDDNEPRLWKYQYRKKTIETLAPF
ncbi:MAG: metallophosphoesterase [Candidatus Helarchaeota archaeon]